MNSKPLLIGTILVALVFVASSQTQPPVTHPASEVSPGEFPEGVYSFLGDATSVGIGTNNNIHTLHLRHSADKNTLFYGGVALDGVVISSVNDANNALKPLELQASQFYLNGGNVGVGTDDPGSIKLFVKKLGDASSDVAGRFFLSSDGGSGAGYVLQAKTQRAASSQTQLIDARVGASADGSGGTTVFRVTGEGNVGVGTGAPNTPLHIQDGSAHFTFDATDDSGGYTTEFMMDGEGLKIGHNSDLRDMRLYSGNGKTARITIDTNGRVGVGTTEPAYVLDVAGDAVRFEGPVRVRNSRLTVFDNDGGMWGILESRGVNIGDWDTNPAYGDVMVGNYDFDVLRDDGTSMLTIENGGDVHIPNMGGSGDHVCIDGSGKLYKCA